MQNRFAMFSAAQDHAPPTSYDGRASAPSFNSRPGPRSGQYLGRGSRGPSTDDERQKVLQAVKDQRETGPRPGSNTTSSARPAQGGGASPQAELFRGQPGHSQEELEKLAKPLLDEFLHNCDYKEALQCISDKFHASTITSFVEVTYNEVLERSEKARRLGGTLLSELVKNGLLSPPQYHAGLSEVLKMAEDLLVDIPKLWDFIADILAPSLLSIALPLTFLRDSAGPLLEPKLAGKYAAAVLHCMAKNGHARVAQMWRDSQLEWSSFLTQEQNIDEFVKSNKLEFTTSDGALNNKDSSDLSQEQIKDRISNILAANKKSNTELFDWIDTTLGEKTKSSAFIRTLVTAVAESVIDGIGGPGSMCKLDDDQLKQRNPVLKKYLDANIQREVEALTALQYLMHRLEHPNKLLHRIFDSLYEDDVMSGDGFITWEKEDNPANQEGKGVALKSCTQFFTWLKEAEEEEEEDAYTEPERTVPPSH